MWPPDLIDLFRNLRVRADESDWFAPWNVLLNLCFPFKDGFVVAPVVESEKEIGYDETAFIRRAFVIRQFLVDVETNGRKETCDVFFLELKLPKYLGNRLARKDAHYLMRRRFGDLVNNMPEVLHGVSAFGNRVAFYTMDRASGKTYPVPVLPESMEIMNDRCPESWWETDILTEAGYKEFMSRVKEAKEEGNQELRRRTVRPC